MPAVVREAIAEARQGRGPAAKWLEQTTGWGRIGECYALANRAEIDSVVIGWLVGMTLYDDERNRLALVFTRPSYRDNVLSHVLEAFAAGIAAELPASGRQWVGIELLARRVRDLPASLTNVIAHGVCSKHALARSAALRLAQRIGAEARAVIVAARTRASAADGAKLDEALAMLASTSAPPTDGGDEALLLELLAEWRATRDPALEEPIALLGARVGRARGDIVAKSRGELDVAWLGVAAARNPLDASRLFDAPWPSAWKTAMPRIEALAMFPDDPRIALRLATLATTYTSMASTKLHRAIAAVIARVPAAGAIAVLDALESARADSSTIEIYAAARRAIASAAPTPAKPELLETGWRVADPHDLVGLYREHLANPSDLAARAVLADALQLAGDPRGEFIALQLAGASKAERRIEELLTLHGDEWSAPLPIVSAGRTFARGFLVRIRSVPRPDVLSRLADRPEWSTVEDATFLLPRFEDPGHDLAPLIRRMPLLHTLGADARSFARLVEHAPIRGVRTVFCQQGFVPPTGMFPDLAVLAGRWFHNAWSVDEFVRVQRAAADLGVPVIVHTWFPRQHLAIALQQCSQGPAETRFAFTAMHDDLVVPGWRLAVRRGDSTIAVSCERSRDELGRADSIFEQLAASGCTRVALCLDDKLRAEAAKLTVPGRWRDIELVNGNPIALKA